MKKLSKVQQRKRALQIVEEMLRQRGGYGKAALLDLGCPWPPQKGWKDQLARKVLRGEEIGLQNPLVRKRTTGGKFYASWEWKQARYEALKIHGRRCQCCGWRPGETEHGHLVVDHIKPRSKYPDLALEVTNLQVLCNDCNMGKSNMHMDDFRTLDAWLKTI